MKLDVYLNSRNGLFKAEATYNDGEVVVKKGSIINLNHGEKFKPNSMIMNLLNDSDIVDCTGVLLKNVEFNSLSAAATFVTGRVSNGLITWRTKDGKKIRDSLNN